MVWRVVATQQGLYNQVLREPGEVFDLLLYADGTYPVAYKYTPKKDAAGKDIPEEWNEETVLGKDKKPIHSDFAEDQGMKTITRGPVRGDTIRFGWMKRVPDRTPVGRYPVGFGGELSDFWGNTQLPPAVIVIPPPRERGPEDYRRNHAPILDHLTKDAEAA